MVYRGKPSAGCENCRKAKKRCTLEQPACTRCVKLKKECVGYRDTTQLQIQDETQSVLQKIGKKRAAQSSQSQFKILTPSNVKANNTKKPTKTSPPIQNFNDPPRTSASNGSSSFDGSEYDEIMPPVVVAAANVQVPATTATDLWQSNSAAQLETLPEMEDLLGSQYLDSASVINFNLSSAFTLARWASDIPKSIKPVPDDVAVSYFIKSCTAEHWGTYFQDPAFNRSRDRCLDLAIKACGMAALNNVRALPNGAEWARNMYAESIRLLNAALKDPVQCKKDESLVAVTMLGFYENLVCHNIHSVQAWKAHIQGAAQLLKLRGRAQFKTMTGRQLFRELRGTVLISAVWDDREPPAFLNDWQSDLTENSTPSMFIKPIDTLSSLFYDFAVLRYKWKSGAMSDGEALEMVTKIDSDLIQWAVDTHEADKRWQFQNIQVDDGPHVWNGMLHSYTGLPVPGTLNMYRSMRVLVSRTHEIISRPFYTTEEESRTRIMYFRTVRRQMTDEICGALPCLLGQAAPAFSSPCVLVSAMGSIWPIFFATTCAFERLGLNLWEQGGMDGDITTASSAGGTFSSAAQQAAWLLGRLDYITGTIGLKWAHVIASSLREAIEVHKQKFLASQANGSLSPEYLSIAGEIVRGVIAFREQARMGAV